MYITYFLAKTTFFKCSNHPVDDFAFCYAYQQMEIGQLNFLIGDFPVCYAPQSADFETTKFFVSL